MTMAENTTTHSLAASSVKLPSGKLLINGELVEPLGAATMIDAIDPATGHPIMSFAGCGSDDVDRAVKAARACFESRAWQMMRPLDRGRLLEKLALLVEEHRDELAALEALDSGEYVTHNPLVPEDAIYRAYTQRRPVGVIGGITPWNFPIGQAIQKLAPAIAFGCTVVLKPSEESSLTTLRLGELIAEAGFPAGAVNIITGYGAEAGSALVDHPQVSKIAFTGSTATGQRILAASAATMKRVTLELGGKSPTIVLADADLERAIPGAAAAIFSNSGQICTAGSRLLVEAPVYDQVMDGICRIADDLQLGSQFDSATQIGPLISSRQRDRVSSLVETGKKEGATALSGGLSGDGDGWFYRPTVLADVRRDMTVIREEIFGPVVCAMRVEDPADFVSLANDTPFGLAASIWTSNLDRAHILAERIDAGTVWLNTHNILDLAMPFGGSKMSGLGREFGTEAVHAYTEPKAVCMRLEGADAFG